MIFRWILSLCVYIFIFWFNIKVDFKYPLLYVSLLILSLFIIVFGLWIIIKRRLNHEKNLAKQPKPLSDYRLVVSTVFKNEGEIVVETLKHYLNYKNQPKIVFYDDHSNDNSFEKLKQIEQENKANCNIKRLQRSKKILHPKGMGFEDLINHYAGDYYLILDADTLIREEEVEKAFKIMTDQDLKVLHFTRRNDRSDDLANQIADTEELFSTVNKVLGIFPWYFNGSGFIIRADTAKKMVYDEYSPSDDSQISLFLRKNNIKVFDTLSLFAHEKAPTTVKKLIKQHSSWTKGGVHHYLEKETFTIFPLAFISAYFLFALFNPLQLYNVVLPMAFIFFFSVDWLANKIIAKRTIGVSLRNALYHTLSLFFKGMVIVPWHIVTFPFKRHSFWFSKTQY
ncbi:MAG: glycosyltransferase [Thermotogota bacterium]